MWSHVQLKPTTRADGGGGQKFEIGGGGKQYKGNFRKTAGVGALCRL